MHIFRISKTICKPSSKAKSTDVHGINYSSFPNIKRYAAFLFQRHTKYSKAGAVNDRCTALDVVRSTARSPRITLTLAGLSTAQRAAAVSVWSSAPRPTARSQCQTILRYLQRNQNSIRSCIRSPTHKRILPDITQHTHSVIRHWWRVSTATCFGK